MARLVPMAAALAGSLLTASVHAAPANVDASAVVEPAPPQPAAVQAEASSPSKPPPAVAADEIPRIGVVESAFGSSRGVVFAGLQGLGVSNSSEHAHAGLLVGGSPLPRLTLHGLFGRDGKGNFSPTVSAQFAFLGSQREGYALSVLAQYKAEGFTEAGGELESGLFAAFRRHGWYVNLGALVGFGLEEEGEEGGAKEEEGEVDAEGKLRIGYEVLGALRVGAIARFREQLSGERRLAGGKNWDFLGGPELIGSFGPWMVAASGGPTTLGVADGVGAYGMLTFAAASRF